MYSQYRGTADKMTGIIGTICHRYRYADTPKSRVKCNHPDLYLFNHRVEATCDPSFALQCVSFPYNFDKLSNCRGHVRTKHIRVKIDALIKENFGISISMTQGFGGTYVNTFLQRDRGGQSHNCIGSRTTIH